MASLSLDRIERVAFEALVRCGATELQAGPTANSVREAEAEGIRNVGLDYLPTYCSHLLCGKVVGTAIPVVEAPDGATLRVDAGFGFCHPAFSAALVPFVDLTRSLGVSLLTISQSYSAGVLGWMVELLAERGMVALAFANSSPLVAPWGGRTPMLGTNPLAFAAPRTADRPFVIDMATSATAWVNIRQAADEGREIPLGWGLDADGRPTTDAQRALDGTVAPLGGAKGFGLALMVEILAAGLGGGNWGIESSAFGNDAGGPPGVGQAFIAIDPSRRGQPFTGRLEQLFEALLTEPGVRLPGDRRHAARTRALRSGVEVPEETLMKIEALRRG